MKNAAFNRLRCRLLSHVTFGKMKRHYRKKYKESLARAEKYDAEKEMNALKSEVAQCVNLLKEDVAKCKDKLENIQNACRKFEYFYRVLFYAPAVAQHHREVFLPYKGVYKNKDIVICASGPTLNFYNRNLLKNAVHIGVNQAVLNKNVGCDYMFSIDFGGIQGKEKEILSTKCEKFFGIMRIPFLSPDIPDFLRFSRLKVFLYSLMTPFVFGKVKRHIRRRKRFLKKYIHFNGGTHGKQN